MKRIVKITALILPAFLFLAHSNLRANTPQATGYVYEDANRNGKFDKNEKGIANVGVTNGREVVVTNSTGLYKIEVGSDNVISVIKPSDYTFPLDENNLPRFYYIHKPMGSPSDSKFKGVAPTGELPKSVNFGLIRHEAGDNFRVLIFGDPQSRNETEVDYLTKSIINELTAAEGVQFGFTVGDVVFDDLSVNPSYIKSMRKIGLPWFNVMGNHDMNYDAKSDSLSDETFQSFYGTPNYALNQGKAHFVVLDDITYPDPRDGKGYWGGFREDQFVFLENDLRLTETDKLIVLLVHIPVIDEGKDSFKPEDKERLFDILQRHENVLIISAHTHFQGQRFYARSNSKPIHEFNAVTTCGDWNSGEFAVHGAPLSTMRDGTPRGYAYLNIDSNRYTIDYKAAAQPKDYQIAIYNPKIVAKDQSTSAQIVANFFMGHKDNNVQYRVDDGKWTNMHYSQGADPAYAGMLHEWDMSETLKRGRRPSNPDECTHLWRAPLPTNLDEGNHTIEVKATDMFGREFTQKSTYRVVKPD